MWMRAEPIQSDLSVSFSAHSLKEGWNTVNARSKTENEDGSGGGGGGGGGGDLGGA